MFGSEIDVFVAIVFRIGFFLRAGRGERGEEEGVALGKGEVQREGVAQGEVGGKEETGKGRVTSWCVAVKGEETGARGGEVDKKRGDKVGEVVEEVSATREEVAQKAS